MASAPLHLFNMYPTRRFGSPPFAPKNPGGATPCSGTSWRKGWRARRGGQWQRRRRTGSHGVCDGCPNLRHRSVDFDGNREGHRHGDQPGGGIGYPPIPDAASPRLQWIEVDLPGIVSYKTELLEGERANCALRRITCDLSDDSDRERLFDQLSRSSPKVIVITEGLIAYLSAEQAAALSRSLHAMPSFRYWIMDYNAGRFRRRKSIRDLQKVLGPVKFRFHVEDPLGFFRRDGWKVDTDLHILDEAGRIGRRLPLSFPVKWLMRLLGRRQRRIGNRTYVYVLLQR